MFSLLVKFVQGSVIKLDDVISAGLLVWISVIPYSVRSNWDCVHVSMLLNLPFFLNGVLRFSCLRSNDHGKTHQNACRSALFGSRFPGSGEKLSNGSER